MEGDDIPHSWFQLYKNNPCVPIDYDTVDAAFDSISSGPRVEVIENNVHHYYREQRITSRILVHPGPYFLRRSLVFNCIGKAEVTIESISGLKDPEHAVVWWHNYHNSSSSESPKQQLATLSTGSVGSSEARRSSASLRHFFGCRFMSAAVDISNTENINDGSENNPMFIPIHASRGIRNGIYNNIPCYEGPNPTAFLILESRRLNEPVVRIRQGNVHLRGLKLLHYCAGGDIWNGNAAVQVQSPFGPDDRPRLIVPPSVVPTANVSHCDIMSMSGRGFVIIDGGISHIDSCSIHNSAATGIYVGGSGSMATITRTDVLENGNGNERNRRGVARGHSGIYVEQGIAKIRDCNVSKNSLTGISAVSSDHATLQVEDSDLICNGSVQLEMPPVGSASRDRSFSRNNKISATGNGRPRSRYASTKENSGPAGGHFPPLPQSPSEFPDDIVVRGGIAVANN